MNMFDQIKEEAMIDELQKIADGDELAADVGRGTMLGGGLGVAGGAALGGIAVHNVNKSLAESSKLLRQMGLGRMPKIKGSVGKGALVAGLIGGLVGSGLGAGAGAGIGGLRQLSKEK